MLELGTVTSVVITLVTGIAGAATGILVDRAVVSASGRWRKPGASRAAMIVTTALGFTLVAAWWWWAAETASARSVLEYLALLRLVAISIALAIIDVRVHRLPDAIVLPSYPVVLVLLGGAAIAGAGGSDFLRAVIAGGVLFVFYLAVRLASPGGMGGGDVKLAGVLGLFLGWSGWHAVIFGTFASFVLGGVVAVVLLISGRATRASAIPFGPWMIAGTWLGLAAASVVWRA